MVGALFDYICTRLSSRLLRRADDSTSEAEGYRRLQQVRRELNNPALADSSLLGSWSRARAVDRLSQKADAGLSQLRIAKADRAMENASEAWNAYLSTASAPMARSPFQRAVLTPRVPASMTDTEFQQFSDWAADNQHSIQIVPGVFTSSYKLPEDKEPGAFALERGTTPLIAAHEAAHSGLPLATNPGIKVPMAPFTETAAMTAENNYDGLSDRMSPYGWQYQYMRKYGPQVDPATPFPQALKTIGEWSKQFHSPNTKLGQMARQWLVNSKPGAENMAHLMQYESVRPKPSAEEYAKQLRSMTEPVRTWYDKGLQKAQEDTQGVK